MPIMIELCLFVFSEAATYVTILEILTCLWLSVHSKAVYNSNIVIKSFVISFISAAVLSVVFLLFLGTAASLLFYDYLLSCMR